MNYTQLEFTSKALGVDSVLYEYAVDAAGDVEIITENVPFEHFSVELQDALIAHANSDLEKRRDAIANFYAIS